ncbi:MAG: hypothetical protein HQ522_22280 [Bacteroidetes bacterium]|nr:hypothetical protein [Bacteroidota bacterium]
MNLNKDHLQIVGNKEFVYFLETELLKDFDTEQKAFIYYVYNRFYFSTSFDLNEAWNEISSKIKDKIFKGDIYDERIQSLINSKIIKTDNHYIIGEKCKSYQLTDDFFRKMIEKKDYSKKIWYSTTDLKRVYNKGGDKPRKTNEEGRSHHPLILYALKYMKGMINYQAFLKFENEIESFHKFEYKNRFINEGYYGFLQNLKQQIDSVKTTLWFQKFDFNDNTYQLYFKVGRNGRMYGGFQNRSRKIKKVLFDGFFNYDLSSSHPTILLGLLKNSNLGHKNFERFVKDPNSKEIFRVEAGLDELLDIKQSFLPILYGGINSSYTKSSFNKIINRNMPFEIFDGNQIHKQERYIRDKVQKINKVFSPLIEEIKEWISYLKKEYIPDNIKTSKYGLYIVNCLNQRLYLDKCIYKNGNLIKRNADGSLKKVVLHKVSSHLINGIESKFIYDMTKTTTENDGNLVVHNDFDGIVCIKPVSEESKQIVCQRNGYFEPTSFIEKDIDPLFDIFMETGNKRIAK